MNLKYLVPVVFIGAIGSPFLFRSCEVQKPRVAPKTAAELKLPTVTKETRLRQVLIKSDVIPAYSFKEGTGGNNFLYVPLLVKGTKAEIVEFGEKTTLVTLEKGEPNSALGYSFAVATSELTINTPETAKVVFKAPVVVSCDDKDEQCKWQEAQNELFRKAHDYPNITSESRFAQVMNDVKTVPNIRVEGRIPTDYTVVVPKGTFVAVIKFKDGDSVAYVKGKDNNYSWKIPVRELRHVDAPPGFETKAQPETKKAKPATQPSTGASHVSSYKYPAYGYTAG